jgi:hypothetical protein
MEAAVDALWPDVEEEVRYALYKSVRKKEEEDPGKPPRCLWKLRAVIMYAFLPYNKSTARKHCIYECSLHLSTHAALCKPSAYAPRYVKPLCAHATGIWGKIRNPVWWILFIISVFPLWNVTTGFWLVMFLLMDKHDEYQLYQVLSCACNALHANFKNPQTYHFISLSLASKLRNFSRAASSACSSATSSTFSVSARKKLPDLGPAKRVDR